MISYSGASYAGSSKLLKRPAVERKSEKMARPEVSRRIRRNSKNRFHVVALFIVEGLSVRMWASSNAKMTSGRRGNSLSQSSNCANCLGLQIERVGFLHFLSHARH